METKKKVLVVVAHPDDEIIWMGGLLLRNKDKWDTTVISLCRGDDSDREPKFKRVCKILNVKCFISDLDDEKLGRVRIEGIIKRICGFIGENGEYDYIFTHGKNGEYGHLRHREIHKAVLDMIDNGFLKAERVLFFSYLKREDNSGISSKEKIPDQELPNNPTKEVLDFQGYSICNSNANIFIKLNNDELLMKKKIIQEVYGYLKGGFEEKSCGEVESFDELKQ